MKKEIHQVDGKFYEKCPVVMLPTEKASSDSPILVDRRTNTFVDKSHLCFDYVERQHLYILSNEEIKEGDWLLADGYNNMHPKHLGIAKADKEQLSAILQGFTAKKIIATTDKLRVNNKECIECGGWGKSQSGYCSTCNGSGNFYITRPSNEFLKKFCELNGIWEVMVEYEQNQFCIAETQRDRCFKGSCKCPIDCNLKIAPDNTITIKPVREEKLYTRDEVENLLFKYAEEHALTSTKGEIDEFNKWIKENL